MTAACTLPPSLIHQVVRSPISASGADEALGPAAGRKIPFAGFLRGKVALKLAQGLGKRRSWHSTNTTYGVLLSQPDKQKTPTSRSSLRQLTHDIAMTPQMWSREGATLGSDLQFWSSAIGKNSGGALNHHVLSNLCHGMFRVVESERNQRRYCGSCYRRCSERAAETPRQLICKLKAAGQLHTQLVK